MFSTIEHAKNFVPNTELSGYIMVNFLCIKVGLEDLDRFETDSDKLDSIVSKIFDFENVAIEQDKLTKTLDNIWN